MVLSEYAYLCKAMQVQGYHAKTRLLLIPKTLSFPSNLTNQCGVVPAMLDTVIVKRIIDTDVPF